MSIRHDPIDAVEETVRNGTVHEIIVSTLPHNVARRLHVDLAHRLVHLGLPITTIAADEQLAAV